MYGEDTYWHDLCSEMLHALHAAANAAGEHGPVWVECREEIEDLDGRRTAVAGQLERDGLAVRKRGMVRASKRRWPALEQQVGVAAVQGVVHACVRGVEACSEVGCKMGGDGRDCTAWCGGH